MNKDVAFELDFEWSGYTIRESKKGWILEGWSSIQDDMTEYKYLLPYGLYGYEQGQDLEEDHNECMSIGEVLFNHRHLGRCLKRGWVVE